MYEEVEKMLNFDEWEKTNFVFYDKGRTTGELRIWSRKSKLHFSDSEVLTLSEAFKLAKEHDKCFNASEHLSSIKIYLEIQKELHRPVRDYVYLSIMNWDSKEKLICPNNTDEALVQQYNLANAILGYDDAYELLSGRQKEHFITCKEGVEDIINQGF